MRCESCGAAEPSKTDRSALWQADYSLCVSCYEEQGKRSKGKKSKTAPSLENGDTLLPCVCFHLLSLPLHYLYSLHSHQATEQPGSCIQLRRFTDFSYNCLPLFIQLPASVHTATCSNLLHCNPVPVSGNVRNTRPSRQIAIEPPWHPPQPNIQCQLCPPTLPALGALLPFNQTSCYMHAVCASLAYGVKKSRASWLAQPVAAEDAEHVCVECGKPGATLSCAGGADRSEKCDVWYHPVCAMNSSCQLLQHKTGRHSALLCPKHTGDKLPRALTGFKPISADITSMPRLQLAPSPDVQTICDAMTATGTALRVGALRLTSLGTASRLEDTHYEDEFLYLPGYRGERLFWGNEKGKRDLKMYSFVIEVDSLSAKSQLEFVVR